MPNSPLMNITVVQADLEKVQPDIADLLFEGQDIDDVIESAKKKVHRDIQSKNDYTDDKMFKIEDFAHNEYLFDRVIQLVLSDIYLANGLMEKADTHKHMSNSIPMKFWFDNDDDGVMDDGEKETAKTVHFGR